MLTKEQAQAAADALTQQPKTAAPSEVPANSFVFPLVVVLFALAFGAATYFFAPGKPYFAVVGGALGAVIGRVAWRRTRVTR